MCRCERERGWSRGPALVCIYAKAAAAKAAVVISRTSRREDGGESSFSHDSELSSENEEKEEEKRRAKEEELRGKEEEIRKREEELESKEKENAMNLDFLETFVPDPGGQRGRGRAATRNRYRCRAEGGSEGGSANPNPLFSNTTPGWPNQRHVFPFLWRRKRHSDIGKAILRIVGPLNQLNVFDKYQKLSKETPGIVKYESEYQNRKRALSYKLKDFQITHLIERWE